MNTGFRNWCGAFFNGRRRALVVAQMLCLTAVAAVFVFIPFTTLAKCGGGGQEDNAVKNIGPLGIVPFVNPAPTTLHSVRPLNAGVIGNPNIPFELITLNKNFTLADLKPGTWLTVIRKGQLAQAEIFSRNTVNGDPRFELWIAEVPRLAPGAPTAGLFTVGQIIKNVSFKGIPAGLDGTN